MHQYVLIFRFSAFLFFCFSAFPSLAAPPKLEWLLPSGTSRGSTTTITLNDLGAWPVQIWLDRADGVTVEPHKDKNKLTVTTTADALPGVRWLRLFNDDGASTLRPLIIGTLPEVEEKEPNNAVAQANAVPDKAVVNGRLEKSGEVDAFRVPLKQGQTLVVSMTANNILASPMDGVVQVCNADGFVLTQNDDARGYDPQLTFTVPRDGDYIVRAFAFPTTPDSTINFAGKIDFIYRLTITTGAFLDHALPLASTTSLAPTSPQSPVSHAPQGWNLPADLSALTLTSDPDRAIATLFHPRLANTLELPLTSSALVIADANGIIAKPQSITPPSTITGRLESAKAAHAFRFTAAKNKALRLRVESQSLGFPIDPVLTVYDAAGKQLNQTDDAAKQRDPSLTFSPPADGDYIVTVRDLHARGGFRYIYRMTVEPIAPDFTATLAADSFVATPTKPLEIPVTIDRRDGFAGEISVSIEGAPQDAAAPAVVSKNGDATAKMVRLIVTPAAGPWSGPIRINATSGDQRRVATFATVGGAKHVSAWLTITKLAAPTK